MSGEQREPAAPLRARAGSATLNQWPLALVLAALLVALGITATGHWRRGAFAIGCSVLLGGILRAVLPNRVAGLLVVRTRLFDSLLLLGVAATMLLLTFVVPHSRP
ncbi:DUF3017 domain-containing protein [Luteococcus peritonei]|uniref:DUF3017 domain-containing protein n=1 Tax=Luteococcus peritonei TaxID=88874 RepID=A0ABW4RWZ3_9ACTN